MPDAGSSMPSPNIPIEDHVLRYVSWGRLRKDEDENVLGILPQALLLRERDNNCLSVTWIEHFEGSWDEQVAFAVQATRRSLSTSPKSSFAIGNVGKIHETCVERDRRIRVVHEPEDANTGHACIRRLPPDDQDLLSLLADDVFDALVHNRSIPTEDASN